MAERVDAIEERLTRSGLPGILDISALATGSGWSGRAEVGYKIAPNVTLYTGGAVGHDWAQPGVDWQVGAGVRVRF